MKSHLALFLFGLTLVAGYAQESPLFGLAQVHKEASAQTMPMTYTMQGRETTVQVDKNMAVTGQDVVGANTGKNEEEPSLEVIFNERGARAFAELTRQAMESHGQIAIIVEGRLISAPFVRAVISGGTLSIIGDFSNEEVNRLVGVLNANWKNPQK